VNIRLEKLADPSDTIGALEREYKDPLIIPDEYLVIQVSGI
jgi:hypothetical protein